MKKLLTNLKQLFSSKKKTVIINGYAYGTDYNLIGFEVARKKDVFEFRVDEPACLFILRPKRPRPGVRVDPRLLSFVGGGSRTILCDLEIDGTQRCLATFVENNGMINIAVHERQV